MRLTPRLGAALATALLFAVATTAESKALVAVARARPALLASQADVVVLGKVVEVEKDTVEATPFPGAPKDAKMTYKIAVLKIEEAIVGGKGLTQFRVGFPADANPPAGDPTKPAEPGGPVPVGGRIRPIRPGPVALAAGQEGCFFLTRHHDGDFYTLANNGSGAPLLKKDEAYAKQMEEVKRVTKAIEDPVAALQAKDLDDRFQAAHVLLQRYQRSPGAGAKREPIPAEESKLIVKLLADLPWVPDPTRTPARPDWGVPSRSALWYMINPTEHGFRQPKFEQKPGDPPLDTNKIMDEASAKFLKDNGEKIRLKRWVK